MSVFMLSCHWRFSYFEKFRNSRVDLNKIGKSETFSLKAYVVKACRYLTNLNKLVRRH